MVVLSGAKVDVMSYHRRAGIHDSRLFEPLRCRLRFGASLKYHIIMIKIKYLQFTAEVVHLAVQVGDLSSSQTYIRLETKKS